MACYFFHVRTVEGDDLIDEYGSLFDDDVSAEKEAIGTIIELSWNAFGRWCGASCDVYREHQHLVTIWFDDVLATNSAGSINREHSGQSRSLHGVDLTSAERAGGALVGSPISPSIIFVVEDEPLLRMEAIDLLGEAGFETLEAPDARTALTILRDRWRDVRVLFTDVQMPGNMSGIDLVEEVHRSWPSVLLLVTSAGVTIADDDLPDDGRFLPKPYGRSTLIKQVREVIARGHGAPS